ncbi:MAG: metal ABC transporter permease [Eubacteriales bacterium]|jgi:manganese/iron transport system permease protein|nr:metal ABC transporter permease [Bacillota bacterium]MBV1728427.1 metal ABC transporter permease [Desulforudis sp.]MDP3050532.1 metal ABC transporter permease [Eubacteriales bacterium]MDQ7788914.1 metal ABC transporter permease [Clostridia bacterium]MBU4532234.1 metal ABC transporter permease [Bacillota bacterium]
MGVFEYQFMQHALLAGLLGGIACSLVGVFVVSMHLSFIGVCLSHAAFAGAIIAMFFGFNPVAGAFVFSLGAAAAIGPLADRGDFNPDASLGIMFSLMLGLSFMFLGLMEGPKTQALGLMWGSILTVTQEHLILLAVVAFLVLGTVSLLFKEVQAVIFNREIALAVGLPATWILYGLLILTGLTVTASLQPIGGLLIFSLILNPAAAAYQLTYSLRKLFILAGCFGVLSCWMGLALAYLFNLPSGATIVVFSTLIFLVCNLFSPKRRFKQLRETEGASINA